MKIINRVAAVCTIVGFGFALWWAYVTASYNDKHKVIAFILCGAVAGMSVFICVVLYRASRLPPAISSSGKVTKKHIYIGPQAIPISIMDGGDRVRVDLVIYSAVNVELRYVKLLISKIETPDQFVMLDSSEPMEIKALDPVNKNLQKSLTTNEITRLFGPTTILIIGSAKFSDGLELTFTFPSIPRMH